MREACGGRNAEGGRRFLICKDSLRVGMFCSAPALPALAPRGSALSFEGCFLNRWENNCLAPAGLWAIGWYGERLRVGCVLRAPSSPALSRTLPHSPAPCSSPLCKPPAFPTL